MAISAKFTADFSSFEAAVAGATAKLKVFEGGSADVEKSLSKMANSFSGQKIIQDANLMTKAITDGGGAAKLTASEMARVNTTVNEAIEKYRALGGTAPKSMLDLADATKQAEKPTDSLNVSFGKLVASYVTAQAIIGAVKGVFNAFVGEIQSSVKAANEAEKANVQMVAALRAQGTAVPSVIAAFQGYASALQQTTVYQDDAIEGAIALLVQVGGVMPKDMEKALQATTNLASGLGKDLTSATMLVAKAAEGNTGALKKAGVVIDETRAKQEGFGYVLDQITEKFGGQAAAIAGTYEGRLTQLGNTWNNVEESIGRVITQNATLLTAFDLINQAIITNTGELNNNTAVNEAVSAVVIGVAKSFSFLLQALDLAQTAYQGLRFTSDAVIAGFLNIGIAVLDTATAIGTYTKYVNPVAWTSMWKTGMKEIAEQSTFLKGAVQGLTDDSLKAIDTSAKWGNEIQGLKGKIDHFADDLSETRGKTVQLKTATDQSTDAWNLNTTAVGDASKKAAEQAKKLAEVNQKIADATRDVGKLTDVQKASVRQYQALGLSVADIAIKMKLSEGAIKAFTDSLKDHDDAVKASWEIEKLFASEGNKHWKEWADSVKKQLDETNKLTVTNFTDRLSAQRLFDDEVAKRTLSSYEFQKRQILQHLADQKVALQTKGGDWKKAFEDDTKVANSAIDAIEWKKIQDDIDETDDATAEWVKKSKENFDKLAASFTQLAQVSDGAFGDIAKAISQTIVAMKLAKESGEQFKHALGSIKAGDTVGGYTQLAGSIAGAVGAMDAATAAGGTTERALKGAASGAAAGTAVMPGFGTAVGAAAGALIGWYRGAKAAREEMQHWRTVVKDFEKQIWQTLTATQAAEAQNKGWAATTIAVRDAYLATGRSAADAERDVAAMWAATEQGGPAAQAAIDLVNQAFIDLKAQTEAVDAATKGFLTTVAEVGIGIPDFLQPMIDDMLALPGITDGVKAAITGLRDSATPDFAKLEALAKTYGGTIDQLGPKFKQAHVTADAQKWISDIEKLVAAGADYNEVLGFMKDEALAIVYQSRQFGTTIPENMRGYLQSLSDSGDLLEENKKDIIDIGTLKFGAAVKTDVDKLKDAIELLAKTIGEIPGKIADINKVKINPIVVPIVYQPGPMPATPTPGAGAAAALGLSPRGVVLPFLPRVPAVIGTVAARSSGTSGTSDVAVLQGEMRGLRTDLRNYQRDQARSIGLAVAAAVQLNRKAS